MSGRGSIRGVEVRGMFWRCEACTEFVRPRGVWTHVRHRKCCLSDHPLPLGAWVRVRAVTVLDRVRAALVAAPASAEGEVSDG